jgi:hypothetical protein
MKVMDYSNDKNPDLNNQALVKKEDCPRQDE